MGTHAAAGLRLEGWKAIARYLGKDTRTALRWVALGLPVCRVNGRNSSVYAYSDELEEWLRQRSAGDVQVQAAPWTTLAMVATGRAAVAPRRAAMRARPTESEALAALRAVARWVLEAEPTALAGVWRSLVATLGEQQEPVRPTRRSQGPRRGLRASLG